MPSKKQQLLNESLQKEIAERGVVFSEAARAAMAAYGAWEKFDRLFPSIGKTTQIVSMGSVGLQGGRSHNVGPYEADVSLPSVRLAEAQSYLATRFQWTPGDTPVLLNQLRSYVLSLYAASMDDATWRATLARSLDLGVLTEKEADRLEAQVAKAGSVADCYRKFHVAITRAHESRDASEIGRAYIRFAGLEAVISSLRMEHPKNLSDVMLKVFSERGIRLPKEFEKREDEMIFSVGSSLNIHHAAFEVLLLRGEGKKGGKPKGPAKQQTLVLVPEGSFEQNIIDPEFFGGRVCLVPTTIASGFKLTAHAMEQTIKQHPGRHFACLMLINPTNPMGLIYTEKELRDIGTVAVKYGLKIICDEHFAGLHHDQNAHPVSLASLSVKVAGKTHRLYDHTLTIQGMSKLFDDEYRKGGIGCCGDRAWVAKIKRVLRRKGAEPSLDDVIHSELVAQQSNLPENRRYLAKKAKLLRKAIAHANRIAGKDIFSLVVEPECGFFTVLSIPRELGERVGIENHHDFSQYALMCGYVYTRSIQGMAFQLEDRFALRLNFGDPLEHHLLQAFTSLGKMGRAMLKGTAPSLAEARRRFGATEEAPAANKKPKKGKHRAK